MNDWKQLSWILTGIILALLLLLIIQKLMRIYGGEIREKKRISRILRRRAKLLGFEQLDACIFVTGSLKGWADHVLIGPFGVLLVYDLCWRGYYYGKADNPKWYIGELDKPRFKIENPLHSIAPQCMGRVRTLLRDAVIRTQVETVVVLTQVERGKNGISAENVICTQDLGSYLTKSRFAQDNGLDTARALEVLRNAAIPAQEFQKFTVTPR